ncbi:hypothetical protein CAEBREN_13809 [Caenorhabditis brenneri]|uniref:Uncharacterized protein n=1 Tax=Caenorhabditis brenneri TaxID=135651 RepID=G0PH69_CAEBE|nr:hypothetical protein CAEBREN_13809 [Caenorhabditis brenneri]
MPSSHHSGNQKMKGERKAIKKCRGDSNKKKSGSQDHKYRCKNVETFTKDNRRDFINDNSSSPPTMRSPWASRERPRPESLWFRSPVRPEKQENDKLSISQPFPEVEEFTKNESSTKHIDQYDSDNESGYVYEKIEGWDTDTDDEEALPKKC